ncbi:MAG: hypothetical protein GPJ51_07135 [Candidatus Heimdallarchaeota archaeon]|nr:hypothetical protein [Candidatus Heimdallarchaeota archaeon]
MVLHKQQETIKGKRKVLETRTNFFMEKKSWMLLFIAAQVWVAIVPYLYAQLIWIDFGVGCVGMQPFIGSITIMFVIAPVFNVSYMLYLYLRKEIKLIPALMSPILSSVITLITSFTIIIPMC